MNCPIREHTGDGVSVGRCWFYVGMEAPFMCPRHGDVTGPVETYKATRQLTNDNGTRRPAPTDGGGKR